MTLKIINYKKVDNFYIFEIKITNKKHLPNYMKKTFKNTFFFILLFTSIAFGCKKTEKPIPIKIEKAAVLTTETLKIYFANMVNVKITDVKYDEKTEQFSIGGYDQIDLKELTESYLRTKSLNK